MLRVYGCVFCSIFLFVCLHVYAYAFESKVHYGSALGPGAIGLPYYCTPPVCVPAVLEGLVVWRHNNNQKKSVSLSTISNLRLVKGGCILLSSVMSSFLNECNLNFKFVNNFLRAHWQTDSIRRKSETPLLNANHSKLSKFKFLNLVPTPDSILSNSSQFILSFLASPITVRSTYHGHGDVTKLTQSYC